MNSRAIEIAALKVQRRWLLILGVLLIGATLRAPITSVGPVLLDIQRDGDFGSLAAGLIQALPLVCFALVSLIAPKIGRLVGVGRALGLSLVIITAGTLVRSSPGEGAVWIGTVLLSAGIAISNVLLPSYVKHEFGERGPWLIGLYVAAMAIVAGIASGIAIPIAQMPGLDWRWSLGIWAMLSLLALIIWMPQLRSSRTQSVRSENSACTFSPWRSRKGWCIAIFFALHSLVFYCVIGWYTAYAEDTGMSAATAGYHLLIYQIISTIANIFTGPIIRKLTNLSWIGFACGSVLVVGATGLLIQPQLALLWVALLGLGAGGTMVMSIALFAICTETPQQAAKLSGMAQFIGYTGAALGPLGIGVLRDAMDGWFWPLTLIVVASVGVTVFASLSGKPGRA